MAGKWRQMLKNVAPSIERVALMVTPYTSTPYATRPPSLAFSGQNEHGSEELSGAAGEEGQSAEAGEGDASRHNPMIGG